MNPAMASQCDADPSTGYGRREDRQILEVPTSLVKLNGPLQLVVQTILDSTKVEMQEMTHIIKSGQERAEQRQEKLERAVRERMDCLEAAKLQQVQQPQSSVMSSAVQPSSDLARLLPRKSMIAPRKTFMRDGQSIDAQRKTFLPKIADKVNENGDASHQKDSVIEGKKTLLKKTIEKMSSKTTFNASSRSMSKVSTIFVSTTRLQKIVFGNVFDRFFGTLIVFNAILIGAEVEYRSTHPRSHTGFVLLGVLFAVLFTVELLLRLIANGLRRFLFGRDIAWNLFDFAMVILSGMEVIQVFVQRGKATESGGLSILRIVRMARLVRIIRVLRFIPQLRMMIFMILESVKQLSWLCCLLVSILYVFSICFTMGATEYLGVPSDPTSNLRNRAEISEYFGTIARSISTCFRSMTSGQDWGEFMDPLNDIGLFYMLLFLVYIAFAVLALLNVVTGVFVDGALAKSQHDRHMVAEKEIQQKQAYVTNLREIFEEADTDESGSISWEEFDAYMHGDEKNLAYLWSMQIDTSDLKGLFTNLDLDGNGNVDIDEFVDVLLGMMKGHKPNEYLEKMMLENRTIKHLLYKLVVFAEHELNHIETMVDHIEQVSSMGRSGVQGVGGDAKFVKL